MYSIVVPCYNEEKNIHKLVKRFEAIADGFISEGFELVLVNNGSSDGTYTAINQECKSHSFITKVNVLENQGYGYGIIQGLKACKGEWLGWIHADLQIPPEAFLEFREKIDGDKDKAQNTYFKGRRSNRPLSDVFFTACMGIFESLYLKQKLWDINAQPTLIHRSFYEKIKNPPYDFSLDLYVYYLAKKFKMDVIRVSVVQQQRKEGISSWNDGKLRARINFINRTLTFSKELKKGIKENRY